MYEVELKSSLILQIRDAQPSDASAIIDYVKQVGDESRFLTFEGKDFNKTIDEEVEIIQDHIEQSNKIFIIGMVNGEIASILNAGGQQKPRLRHVVNFGVSVLKEYWGMGIGGVMIKYLIQWGKDNPDVKKINLMVVEHNKGAIALYEKLGFQMEGRLRKDFFDEGRYYDGIAMGMEV